MINIHGVITGDLKVLAEFNELPARVRSKISETMLRIVIDLNNYVVKNKLSSQLLKRRTGTLAASMQHRVAVDGDLVTGVVGSRINDANPLKYAYPLEHGFDGTVTVKEHLRQMNQAFGKAVKEPRKITVKQYTMKMNVKPRFYLKSSFDENRERYLRMLDKAVGDGVKK